MTDEELIAELQDLAARLGRSPKQREARSNGQQHAKRFGGWNKALIASGLEPGRPARHRASCRIRSDEELLQELRDFYEKHGRVPTRREVRGGGQTARKRFGSFPGALGLAGLPTYESSSRHLTARPRAVRKRRAVGVLPPGISRDHYTGCSKPSNQRCDCPLRATVIDRGPSGKRLYRRVSKVFPTIDEAVKWRDEKRLEIARRDVRKSSRATGLDDAYAMLRRVQQALQNRSDPPDLRRAVTRTLDATYAVEDGLIEAIRVGTMLDEPGSSA